MGQEVLKQVQISSNFNVVCGVDKNTEGDYNFPIYSSTNDIKEAIQVIIDFSIPVASLNILKYAEERNIPIVIATTGFSEEDLKVIENYSEKISVFKSANMSYEVNLMADLVAKMATKLPDSDIEIVEIHHNKKVDSPSGTALLLADSINNALDNKMTYEYNRQAKREKRSEKEIGIHSVRGGTVVGKHSVMFFGENESFEIVHTSDSKSVFAKGALKAAEFIVGQNAGLYSMKNLV